MRGRTTQNAAKAIDMLMRVGRATERMVIDGTAITAVSTKRRAMAPITLDDIEAFARFFDVPITVFLLTEPELLRWLGETGWCAPWDSNPEPAD